MTQNLNEILHQKKKDLIDEAPIFFVLGLISGLCFGFSIWGHG